MNACKNKYRRLFIICLNKAGVISIQGRSKPEAVYIHGGVCQVSPQLRDMRGNQAHACGDYYNAAEALNSVAIKPMRAGIRMALLQALPSASIKGGALLHARGHRGKSIGEDIGESIRETHYKERE